MQICLLNMKLQIMYTVYTYIHTVKDGMVSDQLDLRMLPTPPTEPPNNATQPVPKWKRQNCSLGLRFIAKSSWESSSPRWLTVSLARWVILIDASDFWRCWQRLKTDLAQEISGIGLVEGAQTWRITMNCIYLLGKKRQDSTKQNGSSG